MTTGPQCAIIGNTHLPVALLGGKLKVVELSIDQKPERADERKRIQKAGGRCEALMDETGECEEHPTTLRDKPSTPCNVQQPAQR